MNWEQAPRQSVPNPKINCSSVLLDWEQASREYSQSRNKLQQYIPGLGTSFGSIRFAKQHHRGSTTEATQR